MVASERGYRKNGLTADEAAGRVLELVRGGLSQSEALRSVGRGQSWLQQRRKKFPSWGEELSATRARTDGATVEAREASRVERVGSFADFRLKFLNSRTFPHQQNLIDVIEGRDPSWLHPEFRFHKGDAQHVLVNIPPEHAKSTTVTTDYVVYRICQDPNVRVMLISKTEKFAKKLLHGVKQRLSHPMYRELQAEFAPVGGFKGSAVQWQESRITLGGDEVSGEHRDPTVEAVGLGGQIYGSRADLIIFDDTVVLDNANNHEKQRFWLMQEVETRVGAYGKVVGIGTRVAPTDLYKELMNPEHYGDGEPPWTYLAMPALLDSSDPDPEKWVTLWPWSDRPFVGSDEEPNEDGLYPYWTGPRLKRKRNALGDARFALVYQQQDVPEDAVFSDIAVNGCVVAIRPKGPLIPGAPGMPDDVNGLYKVCSMDPAMTGDTAAISYAVDRETERRYVLDVSIITSPSPAKIRELIKSWTETYTPHEWVIEKNAFQLFLTEDEQINEYLATRGVRMTPHYTGDNKQDPEFGVASMATLFGGIVRASEDSTKMVHAKNNLITLPAKQQNEVIKKLIEQLILWDPNVPTKNRKQDAVMALWFAELRAREILRRGKKREQYFMDSAFTSHADLETRAVVDLNEYAARNSQQLAAALA